MASPLEHGVYASTIQRLAAVFEKQHHASRHQPKPDLDLRHHRLAQIARLVHENQDELLAAVSQDFGNRAAIETQLLELGAVINAVKFASRHLRKWTRPERLGVGANFRPGKAWLRYEPLGVIGIISPWNYPVSLALIPLVDALAAGNSALLKPSELTPGFSGLLARLIAQYFDESEVAVITGGADVAEAFAATPFDHLLFTGSTAIGRKVMMAAAPNLTPVTLELGGKSPAVVCDDYPIDKAARTLAFCKCINSGQTCVAPDYVLAPRDMVEPLAKAILAQMHKGYPQLDGNAEYTSIISDRHHARLLAAIEEARAGGATILSHEAPLAADSRNVAPIIVLGAPQDSLLLREEIFGPILPIIPYDRLEDATAYISQGERPLALYVFSNDRQRQEQVLAATMSGGVTINGAMLQAGQDEVPFGGVGASGMGAYHGHFGFKRFSHARPVFQVRLFNGFELLGMPWNRLATWMARKSIGR